MENTIQQLERIINDAIERKIFKKAVFSRFNDKTVIKCNATLFVKGDEFLMQFECFTSDNKAHHENLTLADGIKKACELIQNDCRQCDIITTGGACTAMSSKSGTLHISNKISAGATIAEISTHDGDKNHILDTPSALPFLISLGIADEKGRIFDKKRAKYRQINRFLELVGDIYDKLPKDKTLVIWDLCCGKSYLTFAVYWYFTVFKKREITMYGVDLKADVIEYCSQTASLLGYDGLHFLCGDVLKFDSGENPDMVISLHACDIATDIVLASAIKHRAKIIMSTPCCHHEMFGQIDSEELSFITDYPILKQKLCDAATDALRSLRLEAEGYSVTTMELIDPEETPKNVLIRGIRRSENSDRHEELLQKYYSAVKLLGVKPFLDKLLSE